MQLPFEMPVKIKDRLSKSEINVYECIPIGKENAISGHDLAKLVKIDERTVASIVKRLRLKHCDIGSSRSIANYGYYRFRDATEYLEYMQRISKENRDANKVLEAMRFTPIAQQITISLEEVNTKKGKNKK